MEPGLKYFLQLPDGTCSKLYEDPEPIVDACTENGRTGDVYAGWFAPALFAHIRPVIEFAENEDSVEETQANSPKPEAQGPKSPVRKKARRAKRASKADKGAGSASVLPGNGAIRQD